MPRFARFKAGKDSAPKMGITSKGDEKISRSAKEIKETPTAEKKKLKRKRK